jgi:hypothetical protein
MKEGYFVKGELHGYGREIHKDGSSNEGQWRDGLMQGKGRAVYTDGTVNEGMFSNHQFIKGRRTHPNGTI